MEFPLSVHETGDAIGGRDGASLTEIKVNPDRKLKKRAAGCNSLFEGRTIRKQRRARQNAVAVRGDNPAIDVLGQTEVIRIYDQPFHRSDCRWTFGQFRRAPEVL